VTLSFFTGWDGPARLFLVLLATLTLALPALRLGDRCGRVLQPGGRLDRLPFLLTALLIWTALVTLEYWIL
jgi:hypothetical protein